MAYQSSDTFNDLKSGLYRFNVKDDNGLIYSDIVRLKTDDPDSSMADLLDAMSVLPGYYKRKIINNAILELKSAAAWAKIDKFNSYAFHSEVDALLDWKLNYDSVNVSSIFETNKGYGTSGHLMSGIVPNTANFGDNDYSIFIVFRGIGVGNPTAENMWGAYQSGLANIGIQISDAAVDYSDGGSNTFSFTATTLNTWNVISIKNYGGNIYYYLNGVQVGTSSAGSFALPNIELFELKLNNAGSASGAANAEIGGIIYGGGDIDHAVIYNNVLKTYFNNFGFSLS